MKGPRKRARVAVGTLVLMVGAVLFGALPGATILGQEAVQQAEPPIPTDFNEPLPIRVSVRIEGGMTTQRVVVGVHRWRQRGQDSAPTSSFTLSVDTQPPFLESVSFPGGNRLRFEPDEERREVVVELEIARDAPVTEGELVILVHAEDETLEPADRRLSIPFAYTPAPVYADPTVSTCVIRADAPQDFPVKDAIDYCDPDIELVREYDRVAVFFTPPRDFREPFEDREPFLWRILGPSGSVAYLSARDNMVRGGRSSGSFAPELWDSPPFAKEGSPGPFVEVIDLWDRDERPDAAATRMGPGTYTLQTVEAEYYDDAGTEVFGGGVSLGKQVRVRVVGHEARSNPNSIDREILAEWEDASVTFEVASSRLYFQGFVTEQVKSVKLPDREDVWAGELTLEDPTITGSNVVLDANAWWQKAEKNEEGERIPGAEIHRASSRLTLGLPAQLAPGHEIMGDLGVRIEPLEERGEFFFSAGMYLMVPTSQAPPDRHLVEGADPPGFWAGEAYYESREFTYSRIIESAGETDVIWVWNRTAPRPSYADSLKEASEAEVRMLLAAGEYVDAAGQPARLFPGHLHDAETLWVIPVFVTLTDNALVTVDYFDVGADRPNGTLSMRSYGYAIYASRPGSYAGPLPTGGPETGTGDDPGADNPGGDDPGGDDPGGDHSGGNDPGGNDSGADDPSGDEPEEGPIDPNTLNPADPDIAALIRQWITVAEPPKNVTEGADFHYNHRGTVVGTAGNGGLVTATHEEGLPFDAVYVWQNRVTLDLDSVNHCRVEEYVVANLEGSGIDHCAGRYTAPDTVSVADVSGMPAAEARSRLEDAGLKVAIAVVAEATSEPEAFTVRAQRPGPGNELTPGSEVQLDIYGAYDPIVVVPDLFGMPAGEAEALLIQAGLQPALFGGTEATSADLEFRVYDQQPPAGDEVGPGAVVRFDVYGAYVPPPPPEVWAAFASSASDSGTWSRRYNHPSRQEAETAALEGCQGLAEDCTIRAAFTSCAAYARDTSGRSSISWRDTVAAAESAVIESCRATGGDCQLEMTFCADGSNRWTTETPIVPPPPPEVWAAFASSTSDSGTWSRSWSKSSQQDAESVALAGCRENATDCGIRGAFTGCAAYARAPGGVWSFSQRGAGVDAAKAAVLASCGDRSGDCQLEMTFCADGSNRWKTDNPVANAWAAFASSTSDPGTWSRSWSKSSQQDAESVALAGCEENATDCGIRGAFTGCAAYARAPGGVWSFTQRGAGVDAARVAALASCGNRSGDCQLEMTFCADGSNRWKTDNPIVVERETRNGTGGVTLTEPRSGLVTSDRVIPVAGEVTDPRAERITLVVNGEERQVSVENGRFRTMVPLVRGQNSIQAFLSSTAFSNRVTVEANVASADIWIQLTWDGPADIDLHLYLPNGDHVYFDDEVSSAGAELDVDNTVRDGPEHITMTRAIRGEYRVVVHYYGRGEFGGGGQVPWQVLVRLEGGRVAERFSGVLNRPGDETVVYTFFFR